MRIDDNISFDKLVPSESKYLSKEDLTPEGFIVTISGFTQETLEYDGKKEEKVIVHFQENLKPMVLNFTKSQAIKMATGSDGTTGSIGKQIIVFRDDSIMFGKKAVGGIGVRTTQIAATPVAPQAATPGHQVPRAYSDADDDPHSDIPY